MDPIMSKQKYVDVVGVNLGTVVRSAADDLAKTSGGATYVGCQGVNYGVIRQGAVYQ